MGNSDLQCQNQTLGWRIANTLLESGFIALVILSGLKICGLSHRGLLGKGTLIFPHFLVLFLVPFLCPLLQRMGGTQHMYIYIIYIYIYISDHTICTHTIVTHTCKIMHQWFMNWGEEQCRWRHAFNVEIQ